MCAINKECNALVDEINRLYESAQYNGINMFMETQVDAQSKHYYEQESYADENSTFGQLGLSASSFNINSQDETSICIQQQILQQASATLLNTANQSPSIALQLI